MGGIRIFREQRLGQQRREEVAVDEPAGLVDEETAVGIAVPGDPQVGAGGEHSVDDELAVLREQRVGLVLGEVPVGRPAGLDQLEPEVLQQRSGDRPGHPVAAVDDDLQGSDHRRVDEAQDRLVELGVEVDLLDRAFAG